MTRQRALLLCGSPASGSGAAAAAFAATLEALDWQARTVDIGAIGWLARMSRRALEMGAAADLARQTLARTVRKFLDQHQFQLIVSFVPDAAVAVGGLAPHNRTTSHAVYCPDVLPHGLWVHPGVDLFLVTCPAARPSVLRFLPDARVVVIPPAVRPEFYRPPQQQAARVGLGIEPGQPCVVLIGGACGGGPLTEIAKALAAAHFVVFASAGRNGRLERSLRAAAQQQPRIRPFGYTDRLPELMAAADLVITTPGATCAEARTVGRPILLLDAQAGARRDHQQHQLALGGAHVTSWRPGDVVHAARTWLANLPPAAAEPTTSLACWESHFTAALATLYLTA